MQVDDILGKFRALKDFNKNSLLSNSEFIIIVAFVNYDNKVWYILGSIAIA